MWQILFLALVATGSAQFQRFEYDGNYLHYTFAMGQTWFTEPVCIYETRNLKQCPKLNPAYFRLVNIDLESPSAQRHEVLEYEESSEEDSGSWLDRKKRQVFQTDLSYTYTPFATRLPHYRPIKAQCQPGLTPKCTPSIYATSPIQTIVNWPQYQWLFGFRNANVNEDENGDDEEGSLERSEEVYIDGKKPIVLNINVNKAMKNSTMSPSEYGQKIAKAVQDALTTFRSACECCTVAQCSIHVNSEEKKSDSDGLNSGEVNINCTDTPNEKKM